MYYSINMSKPDCSLVLGVLGCQVPRVVNLWVVHVNQRIYKIENTVPHFICESDTLPLRRCPLVRLSLWSKIIVCMLWSTLGRKHKCGTPWLSLEHDCSPSLLLNSHGVVCFPFQHAGSHYLIGRQWLTANWISCGYSSSLMIGPI